LIRQAERDEQNLRLSRQWAPVSPSAQFPQPFQHGVDQAGQGARLGVGVPEDVHGVDTGPLRLVALFLIQAVDDCRQIEGVERSCEPAQENVGDGTGGLVDEIL
jgi:hypothetical protein